MEIHGGQNTSQRAQRLTEFRSNDVPVLLLSNVGTCGLNMAFANVLIIVVSDNPPPITPN